MVKLFIRILMISGAYLLVCALGFLGYTTSKSNFIGWFLLITAIAFGLGGPYLLITNLRNEKVVHQEAHDRSFWLILPGFLFVYYASPLEFIFLPGILSAIRTAWMQILGLLLIAGSLILFGWARWTLKDMYSGRIWVKENHTLVQDGPYRFLRHPAYGSYILLCLGISVGYSSSIGLASVPVLLIPGLLYRIKVEETILTSVFKEQYARYAQTTWRLLPLIW